MNINIKHLTQEQIANLRNQLAELDNVKEHHFTDIESWEDAFDKVKPEWYLDKEGNIDNCRILNDFDEYSECNNHIPSKTHAKSIIASCKLMVIAEAMNQGWKPDWNDYSVHKFVINFDFQLKKIDSFGFVCYSHSPIVFKSQEIAEYCAEKFKDLWYDYFMVENV